MSPSSRNGNISNLKRHARYYHTGGDLIIIIDDTSFCVASVFFTRESPIFRERLEASTEAGTAERPKTKHSIVIQPTEKVTVEDFEKLCWVFYNETFGLYDTSLETWKAILRLATQYKFSEVKNLAFRELDKPGKFTLSLVERIVLYRQYDAEMKYLEPLYEELLSRPESLTFGEGDALGLALVVLISKARERMRAACEKLSPLTPLPNSMKKTVTEMVRSIPWNGSTPDPGCPSGTQGNAPRPGPSPPPANANKPGSIPTSTLNGA